MSPANIEREEKEKVLQDLQAQAQAVSTHRAALAEVQAELDKAGPHVAALQLRRDQLLKQIEQGEAARAQIIESKKPPKAEPPPETTHAAKPKKH